MIKAAAEKLLCVLGTPGRHMRQNRRKLLVLMYHGVCGDPLEPFCWHQLPVERFRRQLTWLRDQYTVLPLAAALDQLQAGTLPDHAAAITFDDGFRNNLTRALPVLETLGLPATIFLPTAVVGTDRPLWPDRLYLAVAQTPESTLDASALGLGELELNSSAARGAAIDALWRTLKARPTDEVDAFIASLESELGTPDDSGEFALVSWAEAAQLAASPLIELAPHTETHPILSQCGDARVEREIRSSFGALQAIGIESRVFAYPNGRLVDFDDRAKDAVRASGMTWALSTENGLADASSDPLALPRMCIGSDLSFDRFRLLVTGAWHALRRA